MRSITGWFQSLSARSRALLLAAALIPTFLVYTNGITTNPPGFYIDEAATSYNAYTISQSGRGEFGHILPLYFPVFPLGPPFYYLGYVEPVQIYALAALYTVFTPSVALARGLSAEAMFAAALILGLLGWRITAGLWPAVLIFVIALGTPWLFEMSRLAFSASLLPLMIAVLLWATYRASRKERWGWADILFISLSLALVTYTYAVGRLLGPLLAIGIALLVTNRRQIMGLLLSWAAYAVTLVPMLIFHLQNPDALTGRLTFSVGYISEEKTYYQILSEFLTHYLANISPHRLLFVGDLNERHHIAGTAPVFVISLILALVGLIAIIVKYRRDSWWRFVVFGLAVSVIPASFTKDDFHMLRLAAFPVFLLAMTLPAFAWLASSAEGESARRWRLRMTAIAGIVLAVLLETVLFQAEFRRIGPTRLGYFDSNFPKVFAAAIEHPDRPIYLVDQNYYHAYWQAITQGIDLNNFQRMEPMQRPPAGSLVLSGEERCTECVMLVKDIPYVLYKTLSEPPKTNQPRPPEIRTGEMLLRPRGISLGQDGTIYVADTGKGRILRLTPDRLNATVFGTAGEGEGQLKEPHGIAVTTAGKIYVADAGNHKLVRFDRDGNFEKEWRGPDSGFYGPRDVAAGPNGSIYIVDQGRTRVVVFDPAADAFTAFGRAGPAEGEFNDPSGIDVGTEQVLVADAGNQRIQVFDLAGRFLRQFPVPQWTPGVVSYPDVAIDEAAPSLFVTNAQNSEVLAFSPDGSLLDAATAAVRRPLSNPSALAVRRSPGSGRLLILNAGNGPISQFDCVIEVEL